MPVIYVKKAVTDPILMVADRMTGKLKQAYLDAVGVAASSVSLKAIAEVIERGDSDALITMLNGTFIGALQGKGLAAGIASVKDAVQATYAAGAKAAAKELPPRTAVDLSFDLFNPDAVKFIQQYTGDLISGATAETKAAVKQILERAWTEGASPATQAREIRDVIGLTARQELAVENYRNALESGGASDLRDALSRALRDGRYDRSLLKAIESGNPLGKDKIDTLVGRYQSRMLDYRATSIARTETVRAANGGQRETWRQAKEQGLLGDDAVKVWESSGDDRECDVCEALDGQEAEMDEEFAPGIMEPPDPHDLCRCSISLKFRKTHSAAA